MSEAAVMAPQREAEPPPRPPQQSTPLDPFDGAAAAHGAASLGMWVFLCGEVLFFGVLFAAYVMMRVEHASAFAEASRETEVLLGTLNTAVLLTSSLTMALAARLSDTAQNRARAWLLAATAALGVAFLAIKGVEYSHDFDKHLVPGIDFVVDSAQARGMELFFWLYFAATGFHALHLTIGVGAVLVMMARSWRRPPGPDHAVELTALYWHLVDIVWIFLYPVLYLVGRA